MTNQTKDKYFLYDPEGNGPEFFSTKEQRDQAATTAISECLDVDGWAEYVEGIVVGEVTGKATAVNISHPLGEINEEGYDEDEEHWPEGCTEKCQYKIMPLNKDEPDAEKDSMDLLKDLINAVEALQQAKCGITLRQEKNGKFDVGMSFGKATIKVSASYPKPPKTTDEK